MKTEQPLCVTVLNISFSAFHSLIKWKFIYLFVIFSCNFFVIKESTELVQSAGLDLSYCVVFSDAPKSVSGFE